MGSQLHYYRPDWIERTDETLNVDACVYGGTAAGVVAAVTLAAEGVNVALLHPGHTLGGMTTGGLGWTDHGAAAVIGGRSREFYRRVGKVYGKDEEWYFEPHVAQQVIDAMVTEAGLAVRPFAYLDRAELDGRRITTARFLGGLKVKSRIWIDATYEGDLLAAAGVPFTVGREGNVAYDEETNGVQVRRTHQFDPPGVDPYIIAGDPASGLLPFVEARNLLEHVGKGDHKVQAYNFRVCMTDDPELKIDWQQPDGYDPLQHELAVRWFAQDEKTDYNELLRNPDQPSKFDVFPNRTPGGWRKTDTNNHGPVSSDFIGANHAWPTADHAVREEIFQAHVRYQQGLYWTLANDPRVPQRYRTALSKWGLPSDEYTQTEHWPHQLYIREARRMIGDIVLNEHVCQNRQSIDDPVGMGSYTLDSHNCSRFVGPDGFVRNEGDVQLPVREPYPISYRCLIPPAGSCENLLVPTCISASHIAYGSARMEPVFMLLAESAALAGKLALDAACPVQAVDYARLRTKLLDAGQVIEGSE